jgi:hypothetical protein
MIQLLVGAKTELGAVIDWSERVRGSAQLAGPAELAVLDQPVPSVVAEKFTILPLVLPFVHFGTPTLLYSATSTAWTMSAPRPLWVMN